VSTCDIYATFGAGAPSQTNVPCTFYPNFRASRCSSDAIDWSCYIEVDASVTITDGCTRLTGGNALSYADGMEVRIPSGVVNRYVVVWVETSPSGGKRAYLMRHAIGDWTNL
jgi:hypothetical protein